MESTPNLIKLMTSALKNALSEYLRLKSAQKSARRTYLHRRQLQRWLPSRGNVVFTLLTVFALLGLNHAGALTFAASPSSPQSSTNTFAYQGRIANSSGTPLNATTPMVFRLYSVATGGTPLWQEDWTGSNSVKVSDGLFNVMLGSLTPLPVSIVTANSTLWLGVQVNADNEMTPRVQLGSVPYSVQSLTVPDGSVTTPKIADGSVTSAKLAVDAIPHLLGIKSCDTCADVTESYLGAGWDSVKGNNANDRIELVVTTQGRPLMVTATARYTTINATSSKWCFVALLSQTGLWRGVHLDGDPDDLGGDFGCSGMYIFTGLPAGTYTITLNGWVYPAGNTPVSVTWVQQRQIAVFEY